MADSVSGVPLLIRLRLHVQILAAFAFNALYLYDLRGICIPALNCWACPVASFACPMGALQNSMPELRVMILAPIYILGSIIVACAVLGRSMCGWLCPFGLVQDLVARARRRQAMLPRWTGYLKYLFLIVLGLILPFITYQPVFCKFCPQGALQGGIFQPLVDPSLRDFIGVFWHVKLSILAAFLVASIFIRRPFCRAFCALGAIFSLFGRLGLVGARFEPDRCVDCMLCVEVCPAGIDPRTELNGMNCVGCMECARCPFGAIDAGAVGGCRGCRRGAAADEVESI